MTRLMKAGLTGLVAVHFVVTVWHGDAHKQLAVTLSPEKEVFVYIVIILAPIIGASLVWMRQVLVGTWTFLLSMIGSFLFGVFHHYVLVSSDHIQHLPNGSASARSAFITSAAAIAVVEAVSVLYGVFCLRRIRGRVGMGLGASRRR